MNTDCGYTLSVGPSQVRYSNECLEFRHCEAGLRILSEWLTLFPAEPTWIQRNLGISTLIARIDCTIVNGELKVFEIEERPAGIGINYLANPQFRSKLEALRKTWPPFGVLVSPKREVNDDYLWNDTVIWDDSFSSSKGQSLVLLRGEPDESWLRQFQPYSVSSVLNKGDKSYGVKLGLWTRVTPDDFEQLPWREGFVLKPVQGSKVRGVHIWDTARGKGWSTRSQILRELKFKGEMYLQPLYNPLRDLNGWPTILRIFYGFDIKSKEWICMGGAWVARNNWRVHVTPDSISGIVVVP